MAVVCGGATIKVKAVYSCCSKFDLGLASAPCIPYRHPRAVRGSTVPTSGHSCAGLYRATATTASSFAAPRRFPFTLQLFTPRIPPLFDMASTSLLLLLSAVLGYALAVEPEPEPQPKVILLCFYQLNFRPKIVMFLIFNLNHYCRFCKERFPNQPFLWVSSPNR